LPLKYEELDFKVADVATSIGEIVPPLIVFAFVSRTNLLYASDELPNA
jgi:hypothetical protein